jgi:Domain of unknown function (DUF397)
MVRNSTKPDDARITVSHAEWREFLAEVKGGTLEELLFISLGQVRR